MRHCQCASPSNPAPSRRWPTSRPVICPDTWLGVRLGTMLIESEMAKKTRLTAARRERPRKRAEQQRSIETRGAILDAAIAEFAQRGFEAASIRAIADRLGLQHPLITYHYRSKDILWQAVAEHVFERIREAWEVYMTDTPPSCAAERVRLVYKALFRFTVDFPEFHRFMLQEYLGHSPRLQWVADTVLKPLINWLLPQIRAAQDEGALPKVEPIILQYLLISLTSTLSGFGSEMQATANISSSDPAA